MEIRAAVLRDGVDDFSHEHLELEDPRPGEILVRIVATGICHTDLTVRSFAERPIVLGHEGAGVVEEVGTGVSGFAPGDHVVLGYTSCGRCAACLTGAPTACTLFWPLNFHGRRADGTTSLTSEGSEVAGRFFGQSSFATYALGTERNTVKVPQDLPLEVMGPLGCGMSTGAGTVFNVLRPTPGESLVVFGAGAVGMAAIMAAAASGATTVIAVDLHASRLELALELGATHAVDAAADDVVEHIIDLTEGGAHHSIDSTGNAVVGLPPAVASLRPQGHCAEVGGAPPGQTVPFDVNSLFDRTLTAVTMGSSIPQVMIPQLIQLHRAGRFPFDRLVQPFALEGINDAVRASLDGSAIKPVLHMAH